MLQSSLRDAGTELYFDPGTSTPWHRPTSSLTCHSHRDSYLQIPLSLLPEIEEDRGGGGDTDEQRVHHQTGKKV